MIEEQNEAIQRLQDLEARIEQSRKMLQEHGVLDDQLEQEWSEMLRKHADIRRRLRAGQGKGSETGATLNQDIDVLRHSILRWTARVDKRFKPPRDI